MLFLINPQFFSFRDKQDENYNKLQLSALDGKYIATVVSDAEPGAEIDQNYVNIRTKANEDGSIGAAIYATARNMYDGTAIVVALPYKGYLIPYNFTGLRIRSAFTTKYAGKISTSTQWPKNMRLIESANLPELVEGETNILYMILEPNSNVLFDPKHAHHMEKQFITFNYAGFDEAADKIKWNEHFEITLEVAALPEGNSRRGNLVVSAKTAKNRMAPTIMSNLRAKVVDLKNKVDTLNMPYKIADPTPEKGAKKPADRIYDRDRSQSPAGNKGGYQKREYSEGYQKKPYNKSYDNDRNGGHKPFDKGHRRGAAHF